MLCWAASIMWQAGLKSTWSGVSAVAGFLCQARLKLNLDLDRVLSAALALFDAKPQSFDARHGYVGSFSRTMTLVP